LNYDLSRATASCFGNGNSMLGVCKWAIGSEGWCMRWGRRARQQVLITSVPDPESLKAKREARVNPRIQRRGPEPSEDGGTTLDQSIAPDDDDVNLTILTQDEARRTRAPSTATRTKLANQGFRFCIARQRISEISMNFGSVRTETASGAVDCPSPALSKWAADRE